MTDPTIRKNTKATKTGQRKKQHEGRHSIPLNVRFRYELKISDRNSQNWAGHHSNTTCSHHYYTCFMYRNRFGSYLVMGHELGSATDIDRLLVLKDCIHQFSPWSERHFLELSYRLYKKLKNVSCEYDRLNGWNSTLQGAWYIRHVRWTWLFYISLIIWFLWTKPTIWLQVLILSFTKKIVRACSVCYPAYEGYR